MDLSLHRTRPRTAIDRATDAYAEGRRRTAHAVDALAGRRRSHTMPTVGAAVAGLAAGAAAMALVLRFGRRAASRATVLVAQRRTDDLDQLIDTNRTTPNTTPRADVLGSLK